MTGTNEISPVSKLGPDEGLSKDLIQKEQFDGSKSDKFQGALDSNKGGSELPITALDLSKDVVTSKTPFELAQDSYSRAGSSRGLEAIEDSTQSIRTKISEIREILSSPNIQVKRSYESLLDAKLVDVNEALKIAQEKTGASYIPDGGTQGIPNAVERFLGFLTDSQHRLNTVVDEIEIMRTKNQGNVNPADLLAVQVKVNYVQQNIELFANLLNRGLESTKTLLNVQV